MFTGSEHVRCLQPGQPIGLGAVDRGTLGAGRPRRILQNTHLAPLVMVPVLLLALLAIFFGIRQIVRLCKP